eukprot:TRINITY_DN9191_c0_g1_i10.p1 TRINITY_DN9191_c0_g1~~TRINITY_DN9191_c0_g1_i10.p1  ORF type:complete len:161 (-),score=7.64 TRINITY_DN9191_c0_g1_i10:111-593(-)
MQPVQCILQCERQSSQVLLLFNPFLRLLGCGHTCCAPCIRLMCEKLKEVTCPDCQAAFKPPVGVSIDNYIKSLTTNYWIFQSAIENKVNYERRSQLYRQAKEISDAKKEYDTLLMSEVGSEDNAGGSLTLCKIFKFCVFAIPFFLMILTYVCFVFISSTC